MKRRHVHLICAPILAYVLLCLGLACRDPQVPDQRLFPGQPQFLVSCPTPGAAKSLPVTATTAVWNVMKVSCRDCHEAPSNNPASVSMRTTSCTGPNGATIQFYYDAVVNHPAPAGQPLSDASRNTILQWCLDNGADGISYNMPSSLSWSLATQLAGKQVPGPGDQLGAVFTIGIEDEHRPTTYLENYTDNQGVTKLCYAIEEFESINQDSFNLSTHPVNYGFPAGIKHGGFCEDLTFQGYVVMDGHQFIAVHVQELMKGASPSAARNRRTYVRLQWNQDGSLSFRGKKAGYTDNIETIPWNTAPADPWLTSDTGYNITIQNMGSLSTSRYYWVKMWSFADASGTHYRGQFRKGKPGSADADTTLLGTVGALRTSNSLAWGGFTFGTYTQNNANHKDRWAEWTLSASLHGSGSEQGLCAE